MPTAEAASVTAAPVPVPAPIAVTPAPVRLAAAAPPRRRLGHAEADSILAKIVANLSIPASELGVDGPTPGAAPAHGSSRHRADRKALADTDVDATPTRVTSRRHADREALADDPDAKPGRGTSRRRGDREMLADTDADSRQGGRKDKAADRKVGEKKGADRKALADKDSADRKAKRGEPERVWVQVATGANEGDLSKAWTSVKKKAPDAFRGRGGYSTPLRATNRVVTGPFKTQAEAQAFVNGLAKKGVSASSFTSDAGQKVTRLSTK